MYYKILLTAEHHGEISTVLGDSMVIFVSFIILVFILKRVALGPIMAIIEKRQTMIQEQLDKSKMLEENAKKQEQAAKEAVVMAQHQAQELIAKSKETSEKIKDDATYNARQEAIRIREEAQKTMQNEKEVMLRDLTQQVAEMSIALSTRILKREISMEDHQKLIQDFIEGLD